VSIFVQCPCGKKLQIEDVFAGQEGQCPFCGRTVPIPAAADGEAILNARPVGFVRGDDLRPPSEPPPPLPSRMGAPSDGPPRSHSGAPLSLDADFFAPQPPEIGALLSANSTLTRGKQPISAGVRLRRIGAAGLGGFLIGGGVDWLFGVTDAFWVLAWPVVGAGLGCLLAWAATRFSHTCTYVGREGVARFACAGRRDNLTTREAFRFRDAAELRTAQTHYYRNGVYQNTNYSFTWSDVGGRKRYVVSGAHNSQINIPPPSHAFHFARAAELAWTIYLLNDVDRQVQLSGTVPFNLTGGQWVRLGRGFIRLGLGGEPQELDAADVSEAAVQKGVVKIKRFDAEEGWFSSRGVYKFNFDALANAQLFFHLLDTLVGVRVG
jgi:hypothetical protein